MIVVLCVLRLSHRVLRRRSSRRCDLSVARRFSVLRRSSRVVFACCPSHAQIEPVGIGRDEKRLPLQKPQNQIHLVRTQNRHTRGHCHSQMCALRQPADSESGEQTRTHDSTAYTQTPRDTRDDSTRTTLHTADVATLATWRSAHLDATLRWISQRHADTRESSLLAVQCAPMLMCLLVRPPVCFAVVCSLPRRFKVVQMFGLSFALALQLTLSTRSNTAVRMATATLFFGINVFFVGTVWPYFRPLGNCQFTLSQRAADDAHSAHTHAQHTRSARKSTRQAHAHTTQPRHTRMHAGLAVDSAPLARAVLAPLCETTAPSRSSHALILTLRSLSVCSSPRLSLPLPLLFRVLRACHRWRFGQRSFRSRSSDDPVLTGRARLVFAWRSERRSAVSGRPRLSVRPVAVDHPRSSRVERSFCVVSR